MLINAKAVAERRRLGLFPFSGEVVENGEDPTDEGEWVADAITPPEPTRYVAPGDGDDSADGTSPGNAWNTFGKAFSEMGGLSGEQCLGVVNGEYNDIDEADGYAIKTQIQRDPGERLWIRALDERQAIFNVTNKGFSDFSAARGFNMWGIVVLGDGSSGGPARIIHCGLTGGTRASHIGHYRMLAAFGPPDRYLFSASVAEDIEYIECEAYDGYRHMFSNHRTERTTYTRCYANTRGGDNSAFNAYRANDTILQNCIIDGTGRWASQCEDLDFFPGLTSLRTLAYGGMFFGFWSANPNGYRRSGRHTGSVYKHMLFIDGTRAGAYSESDHGHWINVTFYRCGQSSGRAAAHIRRFRGDGATMVRLRNCAFLASPRCAYNERDSGDIPYEVIREIEHNNYWGSDASDVWDAGATGGYDLIQSNVRDSRRLRDVDLRDHVGSNHISSNPFTGKYGNPDDHGAGHTLVWVPSGNPQKGAGQGGDDIGCEILYRMEATRDGNGHPVENLTNIPLWNPVTGEFPRGPLVSGVNNIGGGSLFDFHERIGVSSETLPDGYGVAE